MCMIHYWGGKRVSKRLRGEGLPFQVIDFVCVLALFPVFLIGLVLEDLYTLPSSGLILTGLRYRVQLTHLVLRETNTYKTKISASRRTFQKVMVVVVEGRLAYQRHVIIISVSVMCSLWTVLLFYFIFWLHYFFDEASLEITITTQNQQSVFSGDLVKSGRSLLSRWPPASIIKVRTHTRTHASRGAVPQWAKTLHHYAGNPGQFLCKSLPSLSLPLISSHCRLSTEFHWRILRFTLMAFFFSFGPQ